MSRNQHRDFDDRLREDGPDAARAFHDGARPFEREKHNGANGSGANGSRPADDDDSGFPFTTFDDAAVSAEKRWLLKHLLARGETSAWVGPPGSLKSAILTDVARAVATGHDWCGKRNKGCHAVVYFALERGDLVRRRQRAFAIRHSLKGVPIVVVSKTINFMDEAVVAKVVATIDKVGKQFGVDVGLIIIDTLAKAISAGGGDEDKARDQGKVYANLARIKEQRDVHVALACHPGKDESKGVRGSSAALGDFDVEITINSAGNIRTVKVTKNNDGAEGPIASFRPLIHSFGNDKDGDPVEVCIADPVDGAPQDVGRPHLSPQEQAVFNALAEAIADRGIEPPKVPEIPGSVRAVVSPDTWRDFYRKRSGKTEDEQDSVDRVWRRARTELRKKRVVSFWDNSVWIVPTNPS